MFLLNIFTSVMFACISCMWHDTEQMMLYNIAEWGEREGVTFILHILL